MCVLQQIHFAVMSDNVDPFSRLQWMARVFDKSVAPQERLALVSDLQIQVMTSWPMGLLHLSPTTAGVPAAFARISCLTRITNDTRRT